MTGLIQEQAGPGLAKATECTGRVLAGEGVQWTVQKEGQARKLATEL